MLEAYCLWAGEEAKKVKENIACLRKHDAGDFGRKKVEKIKQLL
jgi:hypothetical protein